MCKCMIAYCRLNFNVCDSILVMCGNTLGKRRRPISYPFNFSFFPEYFFLAARFYRKETSTNKECIIQYKYS